MGRLSKEFQAFRGLTDRLLPVATLSSTDDRRNTKTLNEASPRKARTEAESYARFCTGSRRGILFALSEQLLVRAARRGLEDIAVSQQLEFVSYHRTPVRRHGVNVTFSVSHPIELACAAFRVAGPCRRRLVDDPTPAAKKMTSAATAVGWATRDAVAIMIAHS
jgi:hypothetical protein